MEAIKKFLNPGKEHEDQVLYGSGDDPAVTGTQPSQTFGKDGQVENKDITGNNLQSSATDPAISSDYGTGEGRRLETGGPSGLTGGGDQYLSSGPRGVSDETSTTASILSGVPGKDQSSSFSHDTLDVNKPLPREPIGTGFTNPDSSSATPHASTLADKVDPRVDSDRDRSRAIGHDNTTGSGLTGNTYPDRTVGSSEYNTLSQPTESSVGRDAALGAGVGAGVGAGTAAALHHKRDQDDLRTASGRSFPAADSSDTSAPGSGLAGITGGTTAGPHSSSLANKADPRVDSDLDGSGTVGPHSSSLANQADPRVHSDLDGSRTAGPHSSSLANKADPRVDSDLDGSRTAGSAGYASGTDPTAGAVPQNVSGRDAYTGSGSEIGILPAGETPDAGYGPESRKHQHVSHGDEFVGDPCHHDGVEGHPLFTKGPHVTDTANLLDPHVTPELRVPSDSTATTPNRESGLIAQSGTSDVREVPGLGSNVYGDERQGRQAPALGSNDYDGERQGREVPEIGSVVQSGPHHGQETTLSEPVRQGENHQGRDAALVGGLGAAGAAAAYSSGRDDKPSAEHTSNITGPHHSKLLNKLDPGVHPDSTSSERPTSTAETSALIGSSGPGSSSHMPTSEEVGASHGHSRDAGVGAGLASTAVAGAADYESEQRPRNFDPTAKKTATSGIGSSDTAGTNTKGDFGHDVTSVVTGGLGTHETENYPRDDKDRGLTSQLPGFLGGHRKSKEPTDFRDNETTVAPATADPIGAKPESDPNYLRDAGLASAGIGGGLAAYETQKIHTRDEPVTASTDPTTYPPSGQEDGGRIADTYAGRDPALASGAVGTAVGTDDGVEFSKREAEKQAEASEKEYQKEQKAIHKEQVKHEKALEKEEKKHEKEELKQEKALEKEEKRLHKEEKKHEKELAKEEKEHHDDGKKHGGILGLFHRDKTDKSDETDVRDQNFDGSYQSTEATGVPDTGIGSSVEHETHKHVPNKLHKDPPAGYYESKGYYPPTTGDGTQPSDSTRTTGPTSGNEYSTGYQQATTGDVYPKVPGGTIVDPQTGLPVDFEKGTGQGGTDSGTTPAFHSREADASGLDRSRDINQL